MNSTYKVSTSEVSTYLTCKQRWMYAHHPSYNLEPRTLGLALTRGVVGHDALELYYKSVLGGKSLDEAASAVQDFIVKRTLHEMSVTGDSEKALMVSSLGVLLTDYFESTKWIFDTYNVVGVEEILTAPLPGTDDIEIAGRVDIVLEIPSGPNKGEVIPYDHKFCYNFWPENAIKMNAQISNYVWLLRTLGRRSRRGIINMLRYRENAVEKFKQEDVATNSVMRDTFIENHTIAAKEIVELKKKPKVGLKDGVTRSVSKFNCEYCPFADLCEVELRGQDSSTKVKARFRPNSYGYDSQLDVE